MSSLDVEALLDSTAQTPKDAESDSRNGRSDNRERDHHRDESRDRDRKYRDRSRERKRDRYGDEDMRSPRSDRGSANGGHRSRRRSRSRDGDRRRSHRDDGDYYRRRSRSPRDDRHYRPRSRREDEEQHGRPDVKRSGSPKKEGKDKTPEVQLTEDERDRRTVFVQQLAARLRTKELIQFFEKVGPVKEAQIVKDRVSGRSKGYVKIRNRREYANMTRSVGYVEFRNEESVPQAIQLTGQKLLGIPIIAQLTEAEKNRQARTSETVSGNHNSVPFHRLYVGNIHFSITESDLQNVFEPFGELEFVQLQKEDGGRSRGYGFVQ
jgi:RNA-binding protein 23/39